MREQQDSTDNEFYDFAAVEMYHVLDKEERANDVRQLRQEIAALRAEVAWLRALMAAYPYVSLYQVPQPWWYPDDGWWRWQPITSTGTWSAPTHGNWCVTQ